MTVRNTQFIENTATRDGGAILHRATFGDTLIIEDSTLTGNACDERGGAARLENIGRVHISNTTFTANTAIGGNSSDAGAIFFNRVDRSTVIGCEFVSNLANGVGGAILSFLATDTDRIEYINTRFVGNESSESTVSARGGRNDFVGCEFLDNIGLRAGDGDREGGAIRFVQLKDQNRAFGRVYNSVFVGNTSDRGGAIALASRCTVDVVNSTFVGNVAAGGGSAIAATATGVNIDIFNNVFADGGNDQVDTGAANEAEQAFFNLFDNDEVLSGDDDDNLLSTDPLFVDPSNGDYSLQAASPAIDAGSSTLYEFGVFSDFSGNPRVQEDLGTPDTGVARTGPVIDMGAFEFNAIAVCPADLAAPFGTVNFFDIVEYINLFNQGCP